jgi:hypothetical protein
MSRDADEREMKELADRLVAMSPEPPPYPEEVSVTRRESSKRNPVLVFAGAALVVLLAAGIPLLLARGGGEVDPAATSTTSTVASTVTTAPVATTSTGETPTTTAPVVTTTEAPTTTVPVEMVGALLYAVQTPENSFTGNPALVAFRGVFLPGGEPLHSGWEGLHALTMEGLLLPDGFTSLVPSAVDVLGVTAADHTVMVDMNEAFLDGAESGLLGDFTMLNQLIYTATAQGGFDSVLFTVNGAPVTAFGSEGLDLSQPQGKDAFLDQLNSINVDSPIQGQGDESLAVMGFANVFEATVSLEVVDGRGNVVHEAFATATCGTGCWGSYEFQVDYPFEGGETVRVFRHSAEDGSPADIVSIPVLWDDPDGWDLTADPGTP